MSDDLTGWPAAAALRWKLASGTLLDPFSLVGVVAGGWAASRAAASWVGEDPLRARALPLLALAAAALISSSVATNLLYERRENELLRSLPLGPLGFLHLCERELAWWTVAPRLLLAAAVWGGAGAGAAALVFLGGIPARSAGLALAVGLPRRGRQRLHRGAGLALLGLLVGLRSGGAPWASLGGPAWTAAAGALATTLALPLPARLWPRCAGQRLAEATNRSGSRGSGAGARIDRLLPLPGPWRARLLRDALLLLRGRDPRALLLLALSPLSCLYLLDELARPGSAQAITWRVLGAAALGGAAVAYAGGPSAHLLRARALAWERVAPAPGSRHVGAALAWSLALAVLHGALTLAAVRWGVGGRHAALLPSLLLPVFGLETALAWFVVAFVAGASDGRRIHGEGTLALMLPVVALGVALVGLLGPWALPLYFVVTWSMVRGAAARIETMEVLW